MRTGHFSCCCCQCCPRSRPRAPSAQHGARATHGSRLNAHRHLLYLTRSFDQSNLVRERSFCPTGNPSPGGCAALQRGVRSHSLSYTLTEHSPTVSAGMGAVDVTFVTLWRGSPEPLGELKSNCPGPQPDLWLRRTRNDDARCHDGQNHHQYGEQAWHVHQAITDQPAQKWSIAYHVPCQRAIKMGLVAVGFGI